LPWLKDENLVGGSEKRSADFLWGTSTSSYQVEGEITNNDWDYFARTPEIRDRLYALTKPSMLYRGIRQVSLQPAGNAVNAWDHEYYEKDFDLARNLGINTFRMGIEWSRLEPEKNSWNQSAMDCYKKMIKSIRQRGMIPIITLNHLTLPLWVLTPPTTFRRKMGQHFVTSPLRDIPLSDPPSSDPYWKSLRGWENHQTVREFANYVTKVVSELKDLVDYWITISEPVATIVGGGYISGLFSPGFFLDGDKARAVLHNLIEAHIQAYDIISAIDDVDADSDGAAKKVGFTHAMIAVHPAKPTKIFGLALNDNREAANNFSYFINDYFVNAVVNGEEDINFLNTLERKNKDSKNFLVFDNWKNKTDFIGINYYRRVYVYHSNIVRLSSAKFVGGAFLNDLFGQSHRQPHGLLNDLGWEIYPQGLYDLIMYTKGQWNTPIFITENGVADKSDIYRAPFIVAHVEQIRRAMNDGAKNIIGYLHWSFMDNYEWQESYTPEAKFGLFSIDHNDSRFVRQNTKGADAFKLIIEESVNQNISEAIADSAISKAKEKYGSFSADGSKIVYSQ
jgi:beta-glucosidase